MAYQKHCPGCFRRKSGQARCPHCGYDESAARAPLYLPHGTLLGGRYRVGRELNRPEPSGILYLGWDNQTQQRVAIKEYLPPDLAARPLHSPDVAVQQEEQPGFSAGLEAFIRTGERLRALEHPHLMRLRQTLRGNGSAYWILDYYEGRSLEDYLQTVRPRLPIDVALGLTRSLAQGLSCLHAAGLAHRGVTPHNVQLSIAGRAVLIGFDDRKPTAEAGHGLAGSDELAAAAGGEAGCHEGDLARDVYGLAACLHRCLLGRPVPPLLLRRSADPLERDDHWSGLSAPLRELLCGGLALRPGERYADMAAFIAALDACLPRPADPTEAIQAMSVAPPTGSEPRIRPPQIATEPPEEQESLRYVLLGAALLSVAVALVTVQFDHPAADVPGAAPPPLTSRERAQLPPMIDLPPGRWQPLADSRHGRLPEAAEVPALRISRSEITVEQFGLFVRHTRYRNPAWQEFPCIGAGAALDWSSPGYDQAQTFPVVCVSAADAAAFADWLGKQTGRATRLPTELEWEYAARAGSDTRFWWGAAYDPAYAECAGCPPRLPQRPTYVGTRPANAFGLVDTAANVREWTCSVYARLELGEFGRCAAVVDESTNLTVRGGSWQEPVEALASGYRRPFGAQHRNVWTGFRVVEPGGR